MCQVTRDDARIELNSPSTHFAGWRSDIALILALAINANECAQTFPFGSFSVEMTSSPMRNKASMLAYSVPITPVPTTIRLLGSSFRVVNPFELTMTPSSKGHDDGRLGAVPVATMTK